LQSAPFPGRVDEGGLLIASDLPIGTFDVSIDFDERGAIWMKGVTLTSGQRTRMPTQTCGFARVVVEGTAVSEEWELASAGAAGKTRFERSGDSMEATVPVGPWLAYPVSPASTRQNARPLDLATGVHHYDWSAQLGAIEGTVLEGGEPLASADVRLINDHDYPSLPGNRAMVVATTDESGKVVFANVPQGVHDFFIRGTDEWLFRSVEVVAGRTTDVTVDLEGEELVEVRFQHAGSILSGIELASAFTDLAIPEHVDSRVEGDTLACRLPTGKPILFALQVPRGQRNHYVHMLAVTADLRSGDVVRTCPGKVELELSPKGFVASTARLDLVSVRGHSIRINRSVPVSAVRHFEGGRIVFSCLPQDSVWNLNVTRTDGTSHSERVEYDGEGRKLLQIH
jgi:hypothetical protein